MCVFYACGVVVNVVARESGGLLGGSFLYSRPDHAQSRSSACCVSVYIITPESPAGLKIPSKYKASTASPSKDEPYATVATFRQ